MPQRGHDIRGHGFAALGRRRAPLMPLQECSARILVEAGGITFPLLSNRHHPGRPTGASRPHFLLGMTHYPWCPFF
jgi:hypothetical protein